MPDLLTVTEVMQRYGVHRQSASAIMHQMPVIKVGGKLFVRASDLAAWEESKTEYPAGGRTKMATVETVTRIPSRGRT